MDGLNPDAPPPKNTEVALTKWEYSDPVGVPHPDVFDIVLTLKNEGPEPVSDLEVEVAGQWKTGPFRRAAGAVWGGRAVLKKAVAISLPPGAERIVRIPVQVQSVMDALDKQRKWPYAFRAAVTVRRPGLPQPLARTQAELPITPGD